MGRRRGLNDAVLGLARSNVLRIEVRRAIRSSALAFRALRSATSLSRTSARAAFSAMASTMALSASTLSGRSKTDAGMIQAYFHPDGAHFRPRDSFCRSDLPNKLRRLHCHRMNAFPIHAVDERHQLRMIELNPLCAIRGQQNCAFLQALRVKTNPRSIPKDNFDSVGHGIHAERTARGSRVANGFRRPPPPHGCTISPTNDFDDQP